MSDWYQRGLLRVASSTSAENCGLATLDLAASCTEDKNDGFTSLDTILKIARKPQTKET